jgi:hypothetical protein
MLTKYKSALLLHQPGWYCNAPYCIPHTLLSQRQKHHILLRMNKWQSMSNINSMYFTCVHTTHMGCPLSMTSQKNYFFSLKPSGSNKFPYYLPQFKHWNTSFLSQGISNCLHKPLTKHAYIIYVINNFHFLPLTHCNHISQWHSSSTSIMCIPVLTFHHYNITSHFWPPKNELLKNTCCQVAIFLLRWPHWTKKWQKETCADHLSRINTHHVIKR